jgi:hypothetical protein
MKCSNCNTTLTDPNKNCQKCGQNNSPKTKYRQSEKQALGGGLGILIAVLVGGFVLEARMHDPLMDQVYTIIFFMVLGLISFIVMVVGLIRQFKESREASKKESS